MTLASLNKAITTLLNKQRKKSWSQSDAEEAYQWIERLRTWLDTLEAEFDERGD